MPITFVKIHSVFGYPPRVEGVLLDPHNKVEHMQDLLQMEDACWLNMHEKWVVLDLEMRLRDLGPILMGDGKTPDTAFEAKERVGGVITDAALYVMASFTSLASWVWPPAPNAAKAQGKLADV